MTSIFKDIKPPLGKYYTSNGKSGTEGINSIITVSDTEVVSETIYKDQEYKKIQLTNPESLQSDGVDGSYSFNNIDMKDYLITLQIMYSPNIEALKVPYVSISYLDLNKNFITNLQSPRGVGVIPPNFILSQTAPTPTPTPTPTSKPKTPEKSFLSKYWFYIVLFVLFIISVVAIVVYFVIKKRNLMILKRTNSLN